MRDRISSIYTSILDYVRATWLSSRPQVWVLPVVFFRLCVARIHHGIGPRFYTLFELNKIPLSRWHNYLLDEGLRPVLRTINNEGIREIVDNKVLFHAHCSKAGIETVPILAKFRLDENGKLSPDDYQTLCTSFGMQDDELFCKRVSGSWGQGSFRFKQLNEQWLNEGGMSDFTHFCQQGTTEASSEWIIQPVISVHQNLVQITSPYGLSTIRTISVLDDGEVVLLAAMLRITVSTNVIDNFSAGKTGNLVAPIDLETGRLGQCKGSLSRGFPVVAIFERHPDTGNPLEGFMMPHWRELKNLVIRAHQSLPQFATLAWDIAVTDDGPVIIEANPTYDVSGMQVAHGKGLRPLLFGYLERLAPEAVGH